MHLTPEQQYILTRMKAGTVLERTWLEGDPMKPAYLLGGVTVEADAVTQLESWGYVHPVMPEVLVRIGYSLYELCPAAAAVP